MTVRRSPPLLQQADPLVEVGVRVGFAGEEEVRALKQDAATEGLMGVEIVAQKRDVVVQARQIARGLLVQPAFGGGDFAVLLVVAVLRGDELRAQRDGVLLAGGDDHRGDRAVVVGDLAALVFDASNSWAMDVLGGEIPGAVQRDRRRAPERLEGRQHPLLAQRLEDLVIHGKSSSGGTASSVSRIWLSEGISSIWKRVWALLWPFVLLHGLLMRQEGGHWV